MILENGDILDLYVSPDDYHASIHGEKRYACVQCHTTVGVYPHPPFQAASLRDVSLQLYQACQACHSGQYALAQDSVHAAKLTEGVNEAAICTDCHTAHTVERLTDPTTHQLKPESHVLIPQICAKCHNAIYQKYADSVHGNALFDEKNQDVPTCIDCHGVHNIEDPTTSYFRLMSPEICAKCHTDQNLMSKYGISTDVLTTYVADFHGTTVALFEKQSPEAETNKAVCFDCHGIHDIVKINDPVAGIRIQENLLVRCKICHPDATTNFPTAWLSHYTPSPDKFPMVFYVDLFYKILIPAVLGGMAILVVMDFARMLYNKNFPRKAPPTPTPPPTAEEVHNG
jgi:hypothetical protein